MSLSSITNNPNTHANSGSAMSQLSQDYTQFMKLLVAQIKHQDPMSPVDGTQFISQVAQLTQVEQAVEANKQMEALRSSLAMSSALFESALIGKSITTPSESIELGEFGGSFSYELEGPATTVEAVIKNADGKEVHRITGLSGEGKKLIDVTWDGKNADGEQLPPGSYKISIAATETKGGYNTYATAEVLGVEYMGDRQLLKLSDGRLSYRGDIVRIN